jgi:AcrR family transcriptional regulator
MARRIHSQGQETRQSILTAASRLFVEKGVDNTSLKDIAREAGISPGTLFYHYSSKSELIFDVTDQHFDRVTQQLLDWARAAHTQTEPSQIFAVVLKTIIGDEVRGKLHLYLIGEAVSRDPAVRERFLQKYREWQTMIESGIEPFVAGDEKRRVTAQVFLSILDGLVLQSILGVKDIPLEQIAERFAASLED